MNTKKLIERIAVIAMSIPLITVAADSGRNKAFWFFWFYGWGFYFFCCVRFYIWFHKN